MKTRTMVTILALSAFATPSLAAEFYVVQNVKTKKCQIVNKRPTTKTTVSVSPDGTVYKTRTEAMNAMKTVKVCTNE